MAPTPQEQDASIPETLEKSEGYTNVPLLQEDDVVISGISGTFPEAYNVKQLSNILYNKITPISEPGSRWTLKHPELSQFVGKIPDVDRFDANFFAVHYNLGRYMDPMARKLLEHTFQALYDAGLTPAHLSGKNVAVFVGVAFCDSDRNFIINEKSTLGMNILGASKSMFANRISYWLNVKGPSITIDTADCSSNTALEAAFDAINSGQCDLAIAGGAYACLRHEAVIHHARLNSHSKDGKIKSFAEDANGYILSDAANVLVLQKAKNALRNYARVISVKNKFVPQPKCDGIHGYSRNSENIAKFIRDFYNEIPVLPQMVEYVEGYGIGVTDVDKSELEAIADVYCKDRLNPLLVGSVTSNIGVSVASSGINSIIKVLLGYRTGKIAANLNYDHPRKDILAIQDGRMRIVNEHQTFHRTYAAINTISFTGCNSHILLCGHYKPKDTSRYATSIPYLIPLSAREMSNVQNICEDLQARPLDAEEIALFHNIHSKNISGHLGRGYIILDTNKDKGTVNIHQKAEYFDGAKRPLWFVYSGMGSQWTGMGTQLMRIPIFAAAIERCQKVLASKGIDLVHIITSPDETMFDNILHSFVGIAAIQIALTDVLQALALIPDGIIGHSVGELGCAYADGCLTAEEMILAAYYRGLVSLESSFIRGSMAAVGLGYHKILPICPPQIDVACRNSSESCTISGPADVVKEFVTRLSDEGIFAKEVPTSSIAYHSRYISEAGPQLQKYLEDVIKNPKPRNERWLSTSVPQAKWNTPSAKFCSPEYLTNNLLNAVLFEDTCQLIPNDAVLVEVAPHGLLQAILKRSLSSCRNIPLTKRGHADNAVHLLVALGDIYMEGFTFNTQALYPKVQFPVSTETPMLSHLIEWMHSEKWDAISSEIKDINIAASCRFVTSIREKEYRYLKGHVIKNEVCYPFAAALVATWDMIAMHHELSKRQCSVIFNEVHFYAQPVLFEKKALRIFVSLYRGTGRFEVRTEYSKVASGYVMISDSNAKQSNEEYFTQNTDLELTSRDIYQLFSDKGYHYNGEFQSIECADASITKAALSWSNNWVTFIDGLLQLNTLRQSTSTITPPAYVHFISIDVQKQSNQPSYQLNGRRVIQVHIEDDQDSTRCGGIVLKNIKYNKHFPEFKQVSQKLKPRVIHETDNKPTKQHVDKILTLRIEEIGKLNSLQWVHNLHNPKHNNTTVTVKFAGLNDYHLRQATGSVNYDINHPYGMDYSGIIASGERVMGIVNNGAVSSRVHAQVELLWPVPEQWSLEDAATVPFAYTYAFYSIVIRGNQNLNPGMKILIHEAAGMIGQAATRIALANQCQVFATVSDIRKKEFLLELFPQLNENNIFNAGDISLADYILLATEGTGCDLVLTCAEGELKNASIKCCAPSGITIDINLIQDREDFAFGLYELFGAKSYRTIDFASIFSEENYETRKVLQKLVADGIVEGYVVPLSRVTYEAQEAERAFKLLAKSPHARVLIRICDEISPAIHRLVCSPDQCQIMFWNDEVLGSQVVEKLITQGAKSLYICCSTLSQYQLFKIRSWRKCGVTIEVAQQTFTKDLILKALNDSVSLFGAIEGIHVVLTTANVNEPIGQLSSALEKIDSMSRLYCQQLKYFLLVSNIKTLGYVCYSRAKSNLPATWLDLSNIDNEPIVGGNNITDAVEEALCSNHVAHLAEIHQVKPRSLFDDIIALAEFKCAHDVDSKTTLQELNLAKQKLSHIHTLLNRKYNIYLEKTEVPLLTLETIRELEKYVTDVTPVKTKGLSTFLTESYSYELLAVTDLVTLSTACSKVLAVDNDYDITGQYLCIIPGIEGHHNRFQLMCEQLKLPAIVLQPGFNHPDETARETAWRYAAILSKKTDMQDNFYLLGYESGAMVSLELAALLENQGFTGTVFLLGYAPSEFSAVVRDELSEYTTEEQLQDAVILHICSLISGDKPEELDKKLRSVSSWPEKMNICTRYLLERTPHSTQFSREVLETIMARLIRAQREVSTMKPLRSKVILLRAASMLQRPDNAVLQQLSQQPVIMHQLRFPLSCVSVDTDCPAFINQYLDDNIIKAFKSKNLCDPYKITFDY